MNIDIATIEREYEQKRTSIIRENELYVKNVYDNSPELIEIESEIKKLGIEAAKNAILSSSSDNSKKLSSLIKKINSLKEKKEKLLKEKSISLEPKFECEKCKDTGYIIVNMQSQMCSCMKQRLLDYYYNKYNILNLESNNFKNFDDTLYSDTADTQKYKSKDSPRANINKIEKVAEDFVNNFDNPETKNLLFVGTPGTGKTFLSGCIANEILNKGYTVLYQTTPLLMDSIFDFKFGSNSKTSKELYNDLFNVDLLIIDDLGTENQSNAKFTELFNIINSRMLNPRTKTLISTNFDLNQLSKLYDDRIISRLIGQYSIYKFYGNDIRLNKTKKEAHN